MRKTYILQPLGEPIASYTCLSCETRLRAIRELNKTQLLILELLLIHTNRKTGRCYPSIKTLQTESGYCKRTVQYALKTLEAKRFITIIRHKGTSSEFMIEDANYHGGHRQVMEGCK